MVFIEIIEAKYVSGYKLSLKFNNQETKIVDLESSLNGPIFQALKDIEFFKSFSITYNTVEWSNGADFAPEYLYSLPAAA